MQGRQYSGRWKVAVLGAVLRRRLCRRARLARSGAALGVRAAETNQQQHNKALHPTARSVVVFAALSLDSKLVVTGGRRVSLALCGGARREGN